MSEEELIRLTETPVKVPLACRGECAICPIAALCRDAFAASQKADDAKGDE
jgi:hypothetical protein